ncbi:hypothetical protein [Roseiflexus sp.]|uniref:hypothetical protein n=1 Tax=Roseiflexus sp. TaxID=2562120 RepID=UPI00398A8CBC
MPPGAGIARQRDLLPVPSPLDPGAEENEPGGHIERLPLRAGVVRDLYGAGETLLRFTREQQLEL